MSKDGFERLLTKVMALEERSHADKFECLLDELMALDERHHLEILLSAARDLVSAIEQKLAGQPTSGDEEEVAFCLCQVDAANAVLTHRQDAMLELSHKRPVYDADGIF